MNVQVAESFWSNFWCSNITKFISSAIAAVKKTTTGMSFKLSIGPSHPISEIVTSHVYWLKKTRSRNMGDLKLHVFLIKRVQCHIFWVSSGCSEVGDHEIYQEQVQVMLFYSTILLLYSVSIYSTSIQNGNYLEINFRTCRFPVGNFRKINQNHITSWACNSCFTHSFHMK